MKTHELKTWPAPFQSVVDGAKTFEIRENDRDFLQGDGVLLKEWEPTTEKYTGRTLFFRIGSVIKSPSWGLPKGLCVFSLISSDTTTKQPN